jgi:UDP-N-acetylmuramoyl-tripeptide--D-alanyl-D-alanine ligase
MMMLSQAANVLNAELLGTDVLFTAVSKDTRTIEKGDLYIAIKGDRFDGHKFIEKAGDAGAVGALVSQQQPVELPQICVADTRLALGELAASWRQKFEGKLIGITGSNGKTTVKEMCNSVLAGAVSEEKVLCTQGNLNNDIGMPMTLLRLRDHHKYAVIEMGANHVGEIDYLTGIAKPDVAVITNVGPAHLEGFGSMEMIARAKAEIYGGLSSDGTAVINLDDSYADYWCDVCAGKNIMTFSMQHTSADVYARMEKSGFIMHTPAGKAHVQLNLPGRHNVMNALATTAAALASGIDLKSIISGLSNFTGVAGRLSLKHITNGACIIDDTYNANPLSLSAAMEVLVDMEGDHWLVLGDMAELGEDADTLHYEVGYQAKNLGITKLLATGKATKKAVDGFGEGAEFFEDRQKLVEKIINEMQSDTVILVKGSRGMAMEKIVDKLLDADNESRKNNNRQELN